MNYRAVRDRLQKEEPITESEGSWKPECIEVAPHQFRWSYFIRKVYETDPLTCPKFSGKMRIISFIDQAEIIIDTKRDSIAH